MNLYDNSTSEEKNQSNSNLYFFNRTCSSQILRASISSPLLNIVIKISDKNLRNILAKGIHKNKRFQQFI